MKFVTYKQAGQSRVGILDGEHIVDPLRVNEQTGALGAAAAGCFAGMHALIRAGAEGMRLAQQSVDLSRAKGAGRLPLAGAALEAPIVPATILCSGSNYLSHNAEKASSDISGKEPEFFVKTADCVTGPDQPIIHDPVLTKKLDGEVELAVVIGKPGRHIPVKDALAHVFGYTIVNDVTARDRQVRKRPDGTSWYELGRGKVFDTGAPLGPCIVSADEIPDPQALRLSSRVNGELRQNSTTAQMIWSVAQLVHEFSVNLTLQPGMVIITGTPSGTAWSTDKELGGKWSPGEGIVPAKGYLQPGDVIECEIEKIGVLRNPIAAAG